MKILVFIKQVPDTEASIKIKPDSTGIETAGIKYVINPYDEYAVEEAIRIKEKQASATVVCVSLGSERVKEALRSALAMGCDDAVHIKEENPGKLDMYVQGYVLSKAAEKMGYDLILCGKQAIDDDASYVPAAISSHLNIPFISTAVKIEFVQENKAVKVKRELESGAEIIQSPLPLVISAQKGLNEPRYASLMNIMKAKKKEIKEFTIQELVADIESQKNQKLAELIKLEYPPKRPPGRVIEKEAQQAAEELVKILREEAKII